MGDILSLYGYFLLRQLDSRNIAPGYASYDWMLFYVLSLDRFLQSSMYFTVLCTRHVIFYTNYIEDNTVWY
jgi:hypothetical protein